MATQNSSLSSSDLRRLRSLMGQYRAVGKSLPPTLLRDYMTGQAEAAQMAGERSAARSLEESRLVESKRMNDANLALSKEQMQNQKEASRMSGLINLGVLGYMGREQIGKGFEFLKDTVTPKATVPTTPNVATGAVSPQTVPSTPSGGAASINTLAPAAQNFLPASATTLSAGATGTGFGAGTAQGYSIAQGLPALSGAGLSASTGLEGFSLGGGEAIASIEGIAAPSALSTTAATTGAASTAGTSAFSSMIPTLGPAAVGAGAGLVAKQLTGSDSGGAIGGMMGGIAAGVAIGGPVGAAVGGVVGLLTGGTWLCTEYDKYIGLTVNESKMLIEFRRYCNSKHRDAFQYYLEHGEELITAIEDKHDNPVEFYDDFGRNVLGPVFFNLMNDHPEKAYVHYSESTLAFIEKFTPDLADGLVEAMDEREVA